MYRFLNVTYIREMYILALDKCRLQLVKSYKFSTTIGQIVYVYLWEEVTINVRLSIWPT